MEAEAAAEAEVEAEVTAAVVLEGRLAITATRSEEGKGAHFF